MTASSTPSNVRAPQTLLRERLDQLDVRVGLYADSDPDNDPSAAWTADNQCALCHTR